MESTRTQYTTTQHPATGRMSVRQEFASKRRRQITLVVSLIIALLLMVDFVKTKAVALPGIPTVAWLLILLAAFLGGGIFALYNWKCPACNKSLGKSLNPESCGHCGIQLS